MQQVSGAADGQDLADDLTAAFKQTGSTITYKTVVALDPSWSEPRKL